VPISNHPSFNRPPVSIPLWRYMDLPKFVDLLTSRQLWLANAEVLARDDPYEGWPGPIRFPHRMWKNIEEVPEMLRAQILSIYGRREDSTPQAAFMGWVMIEEQACLMTQFGRRNYYMNCWHAASHESIAMWKIYASPGAGVAVVSNGARLESALASNSEGLYLGAVQYEDPNTVKIGTKNAFDTLMVKSTSYSYEQEVRLVHWDTEDLHDPIPDFSWNEETMRFENIVDDHRPLTAGLGLQCDVDVLVERVIVSPFAPSWYLPMIERLRDQLGFRFPAVASRLLAAPPIVP
jgi:hypothetical protein